LKEACLAKERCEESTGVRIRFQQLLSTLIASHLTLINKHDNTEVQIMSKSKDAKKDVKKKPVKSAKEKKEAKKQKKAGKE